MFLSSTAILSGLWRGSVAGKNRVRRCSLLNFLLENISFSLISWTSDFKSCRVLIESLFFGLLVVKPALIRRQNL